MSRQKSFTDELWYENEDTVFTIGVQEDLAASIESISSLELPEEGDLVDTDTVLGRIETDQGTIELYSPVEGTVLEINHLVEEDPSFVVQDPSEGWLFKVESDDEPMEEEDEEEDEEEEDEDEEEDDDWGDEEEEEEEY